MAGKYVHFLQRGTDELRFVTTDEHYDAIKDYEFVLRLFVQKYGGDWNSYEELRAEYIADDIVLHVYTAQELTNATIRHDDLRWLHEIPPLPKVEEKKNVAVGRS